MMVHTARLENFKLYIHFRDIHVNLFCIVCEIFHNTSYRIANIYMYKGLSRVVYQFASFSSDSIAIFLYLNSNDVAFTCVSQVLIHSLISKLNFDPSFHFISEC